jgi:hypothetical protein
MRKTRLLTTATILASLGDRRWSERDGSVDNLDDPPIWRASEILEDEAVLSAEEPRLAGEVGRGARIPRNRVSLVRLSSWEGDAEAVVGCPDCDLCCAGGRLPVRLVRRL